MAGGGEAEFGTFARALSRLRRASSSANFSVGWARCGGARRACQAVGVVYCDFDDIP